jgi:hypothetical protein
MAKAGVTIDMSDGLKSFLKHADTKAFHQAANRALNEAGRKAANAAIKETKNDYNITRDSWLKKQLKYINSNTKTLIFRVVPSQDRRPPNLYNFADKASIRAFKRGTKGVKIANRVGVRVKVKQEGGYKALGRNTFIAKMNNGNVLVMQRNSKRRGDIKSVSTVPALGMMMQEKELETFGRVAKETFRERFEHNFYFYLGIKK